MQKHSKASMTGQAKTKNIFWFKTSDNVYTIYG